jgi:hypothetical protein
MYIETPENLTRIIFKLELPLKDCDPSPFAGLPRLDLPRAGGVTFFKGFIF